MDENLTNTQLSKDSSNASPTAQANQQIQELQRELADTKEKLNIIT